MTSFKSSALAGALAAFATLSWLCGGAHGRAAEHAPDHAPDHATEPGKGPDKEPFNEYRPPHNAVIDQVYWIHFLPLIKKERVLQFPEGPSLGEFRITPAPPVAPSLGKKMGTRGRIVVPANWTTTFIPGKDFYLRPEVSARFTSNAIDKIALNASSLDDSEDGLCDRALSKITNLTSVVDVSLDRSDATDGGAKYLASLPNIQRITAVRGALEGACFKDWAALKNLHSLRLDNCPLARTSFQYFAAMPQLQFLSLERCFIKDGEMRHLGNCKRLVVLTLCDNFYINDTNVAYLKNCQSLRFLNLTNTSVTAAGLMKLACLKLQIVYAPDAKTTPAQREALNKAFPGTYFAFQRVLQKHEVDHDDKVLFAPLH